MSWRIGVSSGGMVGTVREIARDFWQAETSIDCAGVAFFGFLSIFPLLVFAASLANLLGGAAILEPLANSLGFVGPDSALAVLSARIEKLSTNQSGQGVVGLLVSAAVALWSGSRALRGLFSSLAHVRQGPDRRSFLQRVLVSAAFLCTGGLFLAAWLFAIAAVPSSSGLATLVWLRWPIMLFSAFVLMCAMFRWGPESHVRSLWRAMPGAAVSSLLWVVLSYLLSLYTEQMGRLEQTYGASASIAALLIWLYFSARACVLGAIINGKLDQGSGTRQALSS